MKKKAVILIDGENFRYSLKSLFPGRFKYLPKKVDWAKLFTLPLAEDHELVRMYWYVVDSLHFRPFEIPEWDSDFERLLKKVVSTKLELTRNANRKDSYLREKREQLKHVRTTIRERFSDWRRDQDRISHLHDFLEFRRCGSIVYNLLTNSFEREKGVDVKLAIDLFAFKEIADVAVLFSGDQDYIPAIQAYKDSGKHIFSVNFETANKRLLPGGSYMLSGLVDKVVTIGQENILAHIKEF
ncbi:MAG: NYN domain-containing protein [Candidatus Aminicenantes bacterium]|nr:NYN domain-containing protein [Candidatus Aminicenantes bacterium]